jgi:phage terminase large subunit-like protein
MEAVMSLVLTNQSFRTQLTRNSHETFARAYFSHYFGHPFADFHARIFAHTENPKLKFLVVLAFRGSGKSTMLSLSLPIWSVVGAPQKKCILLIGQTQAQARQYLANIKAELTNNPLLVSDLGPFEEQDEQWNSGAIVIKQYGAKIIALSREQSIRGLRHLQNRPDLIICDDVEDIDSTRTQDSRDMNFEWFSSEVIPSGSEDTQFVYVGNLVNEDCILQRLRTSIEEKRLDGVFIRVPILDDNGNPTWPQRFHDAGAVMAFHRTIPSESAWEREYMLHIVDAQTQLLRRTDFQYYDDLPKDFACRLLVLGTDLAVSDKLTADYSALVAVAAYGSGRSRKLYVLPGVVNAHMMIHQSIEKIITKFETLKDEIRPPEILIEDVSFQRTIAETLRQDGYRGHMVPLHGMSKRERLELPASFVVQGQVLFPRTGAEELVSQLVNFGPGEHDDLCDAFSLAVNYAIIKTRMAHIRITTGNMRSIDDPPDFDDEKFEREMEAERKMQDDYEKAEKARIKKRREMGVPESNLYDH